MNNVLRTERTMDLSFLEQGDSNRTLFLFYSRRNDENGKRLRAAVHRVIPKENVEIYRRLDDLATRLRAPKLGSLISVLLAADREELEDMMALQDLLKDIHVILAIPDGERRTVELAHRLFPRFLFHKEGDFTDVEKVLSKIVQSRVDHKAPNEAAGNDKELLIPPRNAEERRIR